MKSTVSPSRYLVMNRQYFATTVRNVNIAMSGNIAVLLHPQYTIRAIWLFRKLTLGGKLCIRNDKNAAFV